MANQYLNKTGLTHLWEKFKAYLTRNNLIPLQSKTYTGVSTQANNSTYGYLYYARLLPDNNDPYTQIYVKFRVTAEMANVSAANGGGKEVSEVEYNIYKSSMLDYKTRNQISNTSYRPFYHHCVYAAKEAGITSGYGHLLGFRFYSSYNPQNATYARTIKVEVLETRNCTVEFADSMFLYANADGTGSTNYNAQAEYDGITQGNTHTGDRNTYNQVMLAGFMVGGNGVKNYCLFMQNGEGTYEALTTTSGTGTAKPKNTNGFVPGLIWYYATNSSYGAGNYLLNTYMCTNSVDVRYSANLTSNFLQGYPLYFKFTYNEADGLLYLADDWATQTLPTANDGYVYMYIGEATGNYTIALHPFHPMFKYSNGAVVSWLPSSFNADKVNNHTVNSDVPADAKFTDTTYSLATASADGLMSSSDFSKLSGIESGAQVNTVTGVKGGNESAYRTGNVNITKANVGLGNVDNTSDANKPVSTATQTALNNKVDKETGKGLSANDFTDTLKSKLDGIESGAQVNTLTGVKGNAETAYRTGNVNLTPANIGLGNVNNTSDANKPISTATQAALDNKVDKETGKGLSTNDYTTAEKNKLAGIEAGAQVNTVTGVKGNSESTYRVGNVNITKANIGLGNVDNTSDANKPISTATQTALDNKVDKESGKGLSANDFTDTLKNKLDGIESGAQVNTVTSVAGRTGAVTLSKTDVGLGNVDNTSDLAKPISTATQAALDGKVNTTDVASTSDLGLVMPDGTTITIDSDGTIHAVGGGGTGTTSDTIMDLLWTNPSPSANFAAQTISLDLSDYVAAIVVPKLAPSSGSMRKPVICYKGMQTSCFEPNGGTNYLTRGVTVSNTGVEFGVGSYNGSTNNTYWIPVYIYGLKESIFLGKHGVATRLYTGNVTGTGTVTLSDSIDSFDAIELMIWNGTEYKPFFVPYEAISGQTFDISWNATDSTSWYIIMTVQMSGSSLKIAKFSKSGFSNAGIRVYGIKYGASGGAGSIRYYSGQSVSAASNAEILRITDANITTNTIVLECTFANASAISGDVSWTSYSGYIAFTGTCTTATTANVTLADKTN